MGSAVIHGPHTDNFAPSYRALAAGGGAVEVSGAQDLAQVVARLQGDPAQREDMSGRARAVHERLLPDVGAIADDVLSLMEAST